MFFLISLAIGLVLLMGIFGLGITISFFVSSRISAANDKKGKLLANLGIFSTVTTLIFAILMTCYFFSVGDWGNGYGDDFRTPLGGGFYLLSIDTEGNLPLPVYQRGKTSSGILSEDIMVKGLKCSQDVVYLQFESGSGRIDRQNRTLDKITNATANAVAGKWLSKEDFQKTPCAKLPISQKVTQYALFALPLLIALSTWLFIRRKNLYGSVKPPYESDW